MHVSRAVVDRYGGWIVDHGGDRAAAAAPQLGTWAGMWMDMWPEVPAFVCRQERQEKAGGSETGRKAAVRWRMCSILRRGGGLLSRTGKDGFSTENKGPIK